MLLCLVHILQGTDCHNENLIASGEHPVLIDMETLMHHRAQDVVDLGQQVGALYVASEHLWNSVLRTGLLPHWDFGKDKRLAYDISGLGGVSEKEKSFRVPKWQMVNTDKMALGYESVTMQIEANTPLLNCFPLSLNDYIEELLDGFRQMYKFLMVYREAIQSPNGPLANLTCQRVRFVFRATKVYDSILRKSLQPKFLRDAADRSIGIDILSRAFLTTVTKPYFWPILEAEVQAMEQLDIPYFTAYSNSDELTIDRHKTIEKFFKEPSYDRVISCINRLCDEDLTQQIAIIQSSLYSRFARNPGRASLSESADLNLDTVSPLTQVAMVQQAVAIAEELQKLAVRATDGSVTWIGLGYLIESERFQLQPLGCGLYDGSSGVALFLAALEKLTSGAGFRDLALGALQPLRYLLQYSIDFEYREKTAVQIDIGGAMGLGSFLYALVRCSQFLEEPALLEDARQAASLVTPERIAMDQALDVMTGVAGTILGLLALYKAVADPAVLEQTIACGQHLLNHRVASEFGPRAWADTDGKLLTGFSHGAAGIAYALLQLYAATQAPVFLEAAEEAIAYERSVFSTEARNWPDLRALTSSDSEPLFGTSWCHGAPGIGLARLGCQTILDTSEIQYEIETAVHITQKFGMQGIDHICCGNFGRLEVILVAAQKLSRPALLEIAQKQAAWVVNRAEQTGAFYLFHNLPQGVYNPSFFQGVAGIGYELLRLSHPDLLPSVLLWE